MTLKLLFHQDKITKSSQFSKSVVVSDELATLDSETWSGVGGFWGGEELCKPSDPQAHIANRSITIRF